MARDKNGSLGRNCCGVIIGRTNYTADPLPPCDPPSPVPLMRSNYFGLSLIYRGLDKYEEKDTGIFVARVVPGGDFSSIIIRKFFIIPVIYTHVYYPYN